MAPTPQIIRVPKPAGTSFNPDRPLGANALVAAQVLQMEEAEKNLPPELQTGTVVSSIKTEGQAAAYIRQVTEAIHKGGGRISRKVRATP